METTDSHEDSLPPADNRRDRLLGEFFAPSREAYFAAADEVVAKRGLAEMTSEELLGFLQKPKRAT